MIEPGDGWRFREHLLDLPLLQDQVVEHVLTGHQAVRRVFSDEVCRDTPAMEAIKDQIAHSAAVRHPGLQRLYKTETINKRLALTMEYVQGTTLKNLTLAHSFKLPPRWAVHARLVVRLLRSLSREGMAIDRVRLTDLVFNGGALRVASHQPVSPHLVAGEGVVLNSLRQVPTGGAYSRGDSSPQPAEWKHLMTRLYFMASGQVERDIPAAYEYFTNQQHSHSHLGIEGPIESVLLRFSDEANPEVAWHWDDLLSALEQLCHRTDRSTAAPRAIVASAPPNSSSSRQKVSESDASVEQVRYSLQAPEKVLSQPVIIAPKPTQTVQELAEAEVRSAIAVPPEPPAAEETPRRARDEVFTRDEMRMPGRLTIDEDAEEDRTYLYPSGSTSEAVKKSGSHAVRKRRVSRRRILLVSGGVVGALLLAGVVYAVVTAVVASMRTENRPPIAAIAPLEGTYRVFDEIPLNGNPSSDPDGDALAYNWSVIDLPADQYNFSRNFGRNAVTTELRIQRAGDFTIQLEVFDSSITSEPVTTTVRVLPSVLRAR